MPDKADSSTLAPPACPPACHAPCRNSSLIRAYISDQIKSWRAANAHSLLSLATHLGVSRSTISLWECGKRLPSLENLACLAQVMNVSVCHFFCPLPALPPPPAPDDADTAVD